MAPIYFAHRFQKPSFERNVFKVSELYFSYVSFAYFFYLYIAAHSSYNLQLNWIQVPQYSIPPKVIFQSHELHFIIMLKVVNSDTNSITLLVLRLGPFVFYFQDFKLLFKTKQKRSIFLKISHCPDPLRLKESQSENGDKSSPIPRSVFVSCSPMIDGSEKLVFCYVCKTLLNFPGNVAPKCNQTQGHLTQECHQCRCWFLSRA